jgi:hypothetical protein
MHVYKRVATDCNNDFNTLIKLKSLYSSEDSDVNIDKDIDSMIMSDNFNNSKIHMYKAIRGASTRFTVINFLNIEIQALEKIIKIIAIYEK